MTEVTVTKVCTQCEAEKPATSEFFSPDPRTKSGFQATCKICRNGLRRAPEMPVQPLRENFEDECAYAEAYQWYLLRLDQKAAEDVLADKHAIFSKRESAKRSLKKIAAQQRKLRPGSTLPGSPLPLAAQRDTSRPPWKENSLLLWVDAEKSGLADDAKPWAEKIPFKSRYKQGSQECLQEFTEWTNKIKFFERLSEDSRLKRDDPEAWAEKQKAAKEAERERQHQILIENHLIATDQPFVDSHVSLPAREERAVAAMISRPEVASDPCSTDIACRIFTDDMLVWPDGNVCIPPLPPNTKIFNVSAPPNYIAGSGKVQGYQLDFVSMVWVSK